MIPNILGCCGSGCLLPHSCDTPPAQVPAAPCGPPTATINQQDLTDALRDAPRPPHGAPQPPGTAGGVLVGQFWGWGGGYGSGRGGVGRGGQLWGWGAVMGQGGGCGFGGGPLWVRVSWWGSYGSGGSVMGWGGLRAVMGQRGVCGSGGAVMGWGVLERQLWVWGGSYGSGGAILGRGGLVGAVTGLGGQLQVRGGSCQHRRGAEPPPPSAEVPPPPPAPPVSMYLFPGEGGSRPPGGHLAPPPAPCVPPPAPLGGSDSPDPDGFCILDAPGPPSPVSPLGGGTPIRGSPWGGVRVS